MMEEGRQTKCLNLYVVKLGMIHALYIYNGAARMVTLKDFQDEDRTTRGVNQMEMMFVLGGLMTMMITSLALQRTSYHRVRVTNK